MDNIEMALRIATKVLKAQLVSGDKSVTFNKGSAEESRMSISEAITTLGNMSSCRGIKKIKGTACGTCVKKWAKRPESQKMCEIDIRSCRFCGSFAFGFCSVSGEKVKVNPLDTCDSFRRKLS